MQLEHLAEHRDECALVRGCVTIRYLATWSSAVDAQRDGAEQQQSAHADAPAALLALRRGRLSFLRQNPGSRWAAGTRRSRGDCGPV